MSEVIKFPTAQRFRDQEKRRDPKKPPTEDDIYWLADRLNLKTAPDAKDDDD